MAKPHGQHQSPLSFQEELRTNRRLQGGLVVIALVLAAYGLLLWQDEVAKLQQHLRDVTQELQAIQQQNANPRPWKDYADQVDQRSQQLLSRIWFVDTEAAAQARLNDWLTAIVKTANLARPVIALATVTAIQQAELGAASGASSPATTGQDELPDVSKLYWVKSTLNFSFTPQALEAVLLAVEGSPPLAVIESITINKRLLQAEIKVKVLATLKTPIFVGAKTPMLQNVKP